MSFSFGNDSCLLEKSRLNVFRINTVIIINPTGSLCREEDFFIFSFYRFSLFKVFQMEPQQSITCLIWFFSSSALRPKQRIVVS